MSNPDERCCGIVELERQRGLFEPCDGHPSSWGTLAFSLSRRLSPLVRRGLTNLQANGTMLRLTYSSVAASQVAFEILATSEVSRLPWYLLITRHYMASKERC